MAPASSARRLSATPLELGLDGFDQMARGGWPTRQVHGRGRTAARATTSTRRDQPRPHRTLMLIGCKRENPLWLAAESRPWIDADRTNHQPQGRAGPGLESTRACIPFGRCSGESRASESAGGLNRRRSPPRVGSKTRIDQRQPLTEG